jgi:cytochrome c oxidase assembly protein subunit 15
VLVGAAITSASRSVARGTDLEKLANVLTVVFVAQVTAGVANLALLAPIPLQLVHLLLADLYWIAAVIFGAAYLAPSAPSAAHVRPAISNRSASTSASVGQ